MGSCLPTCLLWQVAAVVVGLWGLVTLFCTVQRTFRGSMGRCPWDSAKGPSQGGFHGFWLESQTLSQHHPNLTALPFPRIFTLYSKSLPLDLACRVWDVFCRDGEEFLFRTALGILKLFEDILARMDFIHSAQFLTRLPEDLPADEVFAAIATVQMQSRNKKWAQVSLQFSPHTVVGAAM